MVDIDLNDELVIEELLDYLKKNIEKFPYLNEIIFKDCDKDEGP